MEESLVLVLGPPPEGWQKELFYQYQNARKSGEDTGERDWAALEQEVVTSLFVHEGDASSTMDELFSQLLGSPIQIMDHTFSMSPQRGLWVANIAISRSDVRVQEGSGAAWPPPKNINDEAALGLMYVLTREWVGAFSLRPSRVTA